MAVPDRRSARHQQTKAEILDAAWVLAERDGIASISLRDLAAAVGMRAPSLYTYFASKDELYDAMFEQANVDLMAALDGGAMDRSTDPLQGYIEGTLEWMAWCQDSVARYQLLYTRAIPGWHPSPDAYASAVETMDRLVGAVGRIGVVEPEDIDLLVAASAGLIAQQMANDPTGDRWTRLAPRTIRMIVDDVREGARP